MNRTNDDDDTNDEEIHMTSPQTSNTHGNDDGKPTRNLFQIYEI